MQKYFYYHKDGITFVFKDGVLESIQIEKPKATWWPAEWPERRDTDKLNWLVFKPAALTRPVMHAQASFPEFARIIIEQDRLQATPSGRNNQAVEPPRATHHRRVHFPDRRSYGRGQNHGRRRPTRWPAN